jgi:hypothetical protein
MKTAPSANVVKLFGYEKSNDDILIENNGLQRRHSDSSESQMDINVCGDDDMV